MFFLRLISFVSPEILEPGQSVNLNNPGSDADGDGGEPTTITPSSHQ